MPITEGAQEVPVKVVGSSIFGRYKAISAERTYNLYISDDWLISFPGYIPALTVSTTAGIEGRALYTSVRGGFMIYVVGSNVYRINSTPPNLAAVFIGSLGTSSGEVIIDENLNSQIALVSEPECWVYNYQTNTFGQPTLDPDLIPNYVTYQNTNFIFGNANTTNAGSEWFVYGQGIGFQLSVSPVATLTLQTKPDFAVAALRIPGKGNNLLVFGTTVAEIWTNIGGLAVYQRNSSVNIDYGCISIRTIAASDDIICWLAINEKSAPAIMVMRGGGATPISTDGIDYLLSTVDVPSDSTAVFYRIDGHLFYQLTFYNPLDNFTITYDFTTEKFYDLTDYDFSYHPTIQVAYFNSQIYFASLKNGVIYELNTNITYASPTEGVVHQLPRIRVSDTIRDNEPNQFFAQLFSFTLENGTEPSSIYYGLNDNPKIDLTFSINGGESYGNVVSYEMNKPGRFLSQPRFFRLGMMNQLTFQMRFWSLWRFAVRNAVVEIRKGRE